MTRTEFSLKGKRIWVAGHRGMVGSALVRRLVKEDCEILTVGHDRLDLRRQAETEAWMEGARPDAVFLAAATVGGIEANTSRPGAFLYDNLLIAANVMEAARNTGVEKLLFLGSSCIYPRLAPQPIREQSLLTGPLEATNQWYAVAKIAGVKLAQAYRLEHGCDFVSVQPSNVYGPDDNFDLATSHVPAALLWRFDEAKVNRQKEVIVWGTGSPRREFLYVDDLADACVFVMKFYSADEPLNIGTGTDISIADFARQIARTVGYLGEIVFDPSKPDGTPRKLLDVSKMTALGWAATTSLEEGLKAYYAAYLG